MREVVAVAGVNVEWSEPEGPMDPIVEAVGDSVIADAKGNCCPIRTVLGIGFKESGE